MSKHTPGPWTFKRGARDDFHLPQLQRKDLTTAIVDAKGFYVAEIGLDRFNANARLIAAAPDLLEAAKAVLDVSLKDDATHIERQYALHELAKIINKLDGQNE